MRVEVDVRQDEIKAEYDRFKTEYPNVYARLLEINRALGALQRSVTKLQDGQATQGLGLPVTAQTDDDGFLGLEID